MKNGIPNYNEIIFSEEEKEKIVRLYVEENLSTVKIGKIMKCSYMKICRTLENLGIKRVNNGLRKYELNEEYFDNIDTPNKAYVLGLMCADGCNFPPKRTAFISLQESDRELLEKIKKELGSTQPLRIIDQSKMGEQRENGYSYNNMCTFNMFSKHICDSLTNLGVVKNKSLVLEFPDINEKLYPHMLRGYFDGDGTLGFYNNILSASFLSTEQFCKKAKKIIENKFGIYCGVYKACDNGITKSLQMSGKSAKIFLDWIYQDADLYLQRKYDRYIKYTAA